MKKKTPAPKRAGTANEKRAKLVGLMLEIASLDRDEYRRLRAEMWQSVAASHAHLPTAEARLWAGRSS